MEYIPHSEKQCFSSEKKQFFPVVLGAYPEANVTASNCCCKAVLPGGQARSKGNKEKH